MPCLGRLATFIDGALGKSNARHLVGADDGDVLNAACLLEMVVMLLLQVCNFERTQDEKHARVQLEEGWWHLRSCVLPVGVAY